MTVVIVLLTMGGGATALLSGVLLWRQRRQHRAQEEAAARTRATLVRAAAHELRQPLNAIVGLVGSMRSGGQQSDSLRPGVAERLDRSVRELNDALINTLDIFDLSAGELSLDRQPADLRTEILLLIRKTNRRLLEEKPGVTVEAGFLPEFWCEIDAHRLKHCLSVLLEQAIWQTTRGKILVSSRTEKIHGANHRVTLMVRDNGRGMDQHRAERFFDPSRFAQNPELRGRPAAMLALNLTREVAQLMGGSVTVQSRVGSGTSFFLSAVAETCPSAMNETITEALPAHGDQTSRGAPRFDALSVLLVDDNEVNLFVLQEFILPLDFGHVVCAASGEEAIACAQNEAFDLILMDLAMPETDGFMASKAIREDGLSQKAPIIAVSAEHLRKDDQRLVDAGIDGFVPKPVVNADLFAAILKTAPQMLSHAKRRGVDLEAEESARLAG